MRGSTIKSNQLTPGTVIVYLLRPSQLPTDPTKEWRGRVLGPYGAEAVMVEVLNEGFEGEQEPAFIDQIIRVEDEAGEVHG
jgi:hypothetical protein